MIKWEYRVVVIRYPQQVRDLATNLSSIGSDGWELVSFVPALESLKYGEPVAVFKRPVETEEHTE